MIFSGFGDTADDIGAEITDRVQEMVDINNALYDSAKGSTRLTARVDNWHQTALAWMKQAPAAAQSQQALAAWSLLGVKIASNAQDYANEIADASLASRIGDFITRIPQSAEIVGGWLADAAQASVRRAGDVVNEAVKQAGKGLQGAGLNVGLTVVYIGAAAALGFWLLKKSGAKVRTRYVEAG